MTEKIVHVALLDEGVEVWRPVPATEEGPGVYRLLGGKDDGEHWAFAPGSTVRCETKQLEDGPALVAVALT